MDMIMDAIINWLREILVGGIMSNLSGLFEQVNTKVGEISGEVGMTPQGWNSGIFNMVHNLSETVILPIAGVMLAFVATLELIQFITEKNNILCCLSTMKRNATLTREKRNMVRTVFVLFVMWMQSSRSPLSENCLSNTSR